MGGIQKIAFIVENAEKHFKVGVIKNINRDFTNKAFCDFEDGFGFYTKGFTRNDSIDSGLFYGESLDISQLRIVITMIVNLGQGKIEF